VVPDSDASYNRDDNPALLDSASESFPETAPPPILPDQEDLLGLRIAAALVDLVLLIGLGLLLGLTVGDSSVGEGSFSVSLTGWWLLLYVAVVLVYYFAVEAATGQTVGKRLLGLRVLGIEGRRASISAIAGRTLLRVVDWLPVMYLVGFITMLATGVPRKRVGDLAAKTVVARALPGQRRSLALAPLILVLAAVAGLSVYRATSDEGSRTYQGHGISFDYPAGWNEMDIKPTQSAGGAEKLWTAAVGLGQHDLVVVYAYRLNYSVTDENLPTVMSYFDEIIQDGYKQIGGTLLDGPEKVTIAGKLGFRFAGTQTIDTPPTGMTDVFVFDGTTEYQVRCQHTPDNATQVERACDQVLRSFTLT